MPDIISVTFDSLYFAIQSLQYAANGTDPSTSDISAITSNAQTLRCYEEVIGKIGKLLQQYKSLLLKDCTSLDDVHSNMVSFDDRLSRQFMFQR